MGAIKYLFVCLGCVIGINPLTADEDLIPGNPVNLGEGVNRTTSEIHAEENFPNDPPVQSLTVERDLPQPAQANHSCTFQLDHSYNTSFKDQALGNYEKIVQVMSAIAVYPKPNFTAVTYPESLYIPPNNMGAVGPTQYIIQINGRIRSFHKTTGHADGILNITTDAFYASVRGPAGTIDPRIRYDKTSDRWFLYCGTFATGVAPNRGLIAVSDSGIITNATVWSFFQFEPSAIAPPRANTLDYADYPTLGIDQYALYVGYNIFDVNTNAFINSDIFVINKAALLANSLVITAFRNVAFPGPTTPQGVDVYDASETEGFFIGVSSQFFGQLDLIRIFNPGGVPSRSAFIPISIPLTANPLFVPHLGNNAGPMGELNALDQRLSNCHVRDSQLYTSNNIGVDNTGVSSGTITRDACRWYQIDITNPGTPVVIQVGTLFQPSVTNDLNQRFFFTPAIMTNGLHNIIMGCSTAGAPYYADAAFTQHFEGDPLGFTRPPTIYTRSTTPYNLGPGGPRGRRWGDNSSASLDPSDNLTLWIMQEWCSDTDTWGCQVGRILAGLPASAVTVTPNQVPINTSTTITITGVRPPGGGFYEPGVGFPKHLTVLINDVIVNSVTVVSATQLDVSITTGASTGFKRILITNPDGQKFASEVAFEVIP